MFEFITDLLGPITITQVVVIILLIGVTSYYIYRNIGSGNNDILTKMTPLNKKIDIYTADKVQSTLLGSGGSTVMGFIFLDQGDRTTNYKNDYLPLLFVDNNWWLEISHGAAAIATRLRVQTNYSGKMTYEYVELPPIPKQKWVCVTILREGRRFDVIYDNRIVASKRLEHYPVVISSPLSIGNPKITGNIIHIILNAQRLTPDQVERQRNVYVDTNNKVLEANNILISFPTLRLNAECPSGLPCNNITKPPKNPMLKWESPYA